MWQGAVLVRNTYVFLVLDSRVRLKMCERTRNQMIMAMVMMMVRGGGANESLFVDLDTVRLFLLVHCQLLV